MLYIAKDRSAVRLEDGVYLHVYNPRLSDAPEGAIVARQMGKHGLTLDYTHRDGSTLSISIGRDNIITLDVSFTRNDVFVTISHTASSYVLPSDPIVHTLRVKDSVVIPLLTNDADDIDFTFFDTSFFSIAIITVDYNKSFVYIDAPRDKPNITLRTNDDIDSVVKTVVETLEQAGVKVVLMEV